MMTLKDLIKAGDQSVLLQMTTFENQIKEILAEDRVEQINQLEAKFQELKTELNKGNKEMLEAVVTSMAILQGQNTTMKSVVDHLWETTKVNRMILGVAIVFLVIFVLGICCWLLCLKKGKRTGIKININGEMYLYYPKIKKDGQYVSLHKVEENFLAFQHIADLRKSVKKSFSNNPSLVRQEMQSNRLIRAERNS